MTTTNTISTAWVDSIDRSYLTEAQLDDIHRSGVTTGNLLLQLDTGETLVRPFCWLWVESYSQWTLVNTVTGTLYNPHNGECAAGSPTAPRIVGELPAMPHRDALVQPIRSASKEYAL